MKTVSIIISAKGRIRLLKQTLKSLFRNTTLPFELIIVADGPDKEVKRYLEKLKRLRANVRIVFMLASKGWSAAHNAGIAVAGDVDYYYISDSDVYFEKGWLKTLLKIAENAKIGIVGGRTHGSHKIVEIKDGVKYTRMQSGYSMLVSRDIWLKCGPLIQFPVKVKGGPDVAFERKVLALGLKIAQPAKQVIFHCGLSNSRGEPVQGLESEKRQPFPEGVIAE